jgi:hypothetical protein
MQINYKYIITVLSLFFITNAYTATLKSGMTVPVRLVQNINANLNNTGETIYFQVTENVIVNKLILIKKGSFVKGFVSEAIGRKSLGKGGILTITPKSLVNKNGEVIKFESNPLSAEGRKRTGATVAHVVMWGPLGLFAKGRAAFILRDTEFDLSILDDVEITTVKTDITDTKKLITLDATFKKYSSKINYRKGKTGKDFTVYLHGLNSISGNQIKTNSFLITKVDGYKLPKPLQPISIKSNSKENRFEFTFAFKDIIKYILPGSVKFEFNINNTYQAESELTTKWKLK